MTMRWLSCLWLGGMIHGQDFRPIPRVQAIPLPHDQVSFQRDEKEIARYHFGADLFRPFVYPVIGPAGRALTRMGHPGDPDSHSHHNSIWLSFSNVNGVDFWSDRGGGRIRHRRLVQLEDGDSFALAIAEADWLSPGGIPILREQRHTIVKLLPANEWLLVLDLRLESAGGAVAVDKGTFGPIGVRMAKWIGVHHGNGRLRNSEGGEGEAAVFRKAARWADYAGQVSPGVVEGLTLMDHPANPRHPPPFHVREDGWMGAMPALERPLIIEPGAPLRLRYAVYVHAGMPTLSAIDRVWQEFAKDPLRPPVGPPQSPRDCRHGGHRRFTVPRAFASERDCEAFFAEGK